jgi:hypothetical protein
MRLPRYLGFQGHRREHQWSPVGYLNFQKKDQYQDKKIQKCND